MERVLRLPCNEQWYWGILTGEIPFDYREVKPYWIKRLENKEYDVVEFYHRFKKNLEPIKYKLLSIEKHEPVYFIKFGERVK